MDWDTGSVDSQRTADSVQSVENRVIQPEAYDYSKLTDLSGVPICAMCDHLIEEGQPKTELFCKHNLHTLCFTSGYYNLDISRCMRCNRSYFTEADHQNQEPIIATLREKKQMKKQNKVHTLREEVFANKELLTDLKLVKKSIREASGSSTKFRTYAKQTGRLFQEEMKPLKDILRESRKKYRGKIMKSEEMKQWRKKKARASYFTRVFDQKYPNYSLDRLSSIPELKIPNRWSMRRALHIYSWTINRFLPVHL